MDLTRGRKYEVVCEDFTVNRCVYDRVRSRGYHFKKSVRESSDVTHHEFDMLKVTETPSGCYVEVDSKKYKVSISLVECKFVVGKKYLFTTEYGVSRVGTFKGYKFGLRFKYHRKDRKPAGMGGVSLVEFEPNCYYFYVENVTTDRVYVREL